MKNSTFKKKLEGDYFQKQKKVLALEVIYTFNYIDGIEFNLLQGKFLLNKSPFVH